MADMTMQRPAIEVLTGDRNFSSRTLAFEVLSDLQATADTATVRLEDLLSEISGTIHRGDPITLGWGTNSSNKFEIFAGVVRDVDSSRDPLILRCIDYNTILASRRVSITFQDETAEGIVQALLADTGLTVEAEDSGIEFERLPLFNVTLREAIDSISNSVRRKTGVQWYDYIREGVFHWGQADHEQDPVHSFRSGVDVIRFDRSIKGFSTLASLIVPVRHSETVLVDGEKYFVMNAQYRWQDGGRTTLGLEKCG